MIHQRHTRIVQACRILAVAVLGLAAASPALADCKLKITNLKTVDFHGPAGHGYEVFHGEQHSEAVEFKVERKSGSCSFIVGFSRGNGGPLTDRRLSFGGNSLRYQLYKNLSATQILKDVPLANTDEVLSGTLSSSQDSVSFQFYFAIPFLQIVPPGTYRDTVRVSVYEGTVQSAQLRDQEQLRLEARVPTTAEFGFGGSHHFEPGDRAAKVDFDNLSVGAVRQMHLHARSNSGYRITLRSVNGGVLKNSAPRDDSRVPYTLQVDGAPVALGGSAPVTVIGRSGLTSELGTEHHLRFSLGDISDAGPGTYEDVIQVTLFPAR